MNFFIKMLSFLLKVIEHFDIVEEAFEDFSIKTLIDCGKHSHFIDYLLNETQSKDITPKYINYFERYDFKI